MRKIIKSTNWRHMERTRDNWEDPVKIWNIVHHCLWLSTQGIYLLHDVWLSLWTVECIWKDSVPVWILSSKYGVYFYSWCLWCFWPPSGEEHASGSWCPFSLGLRKRNERTIARREAWSIYKPVQTNTSINCELTAAS